MKARNSDSGIKSMASAMGTMKAGPSRPPCGGYEAGEEGGFQPVALPGGQDIDSQDGEHEDDRREVPEQDDPVYAADLLEHGPENVIAHPEVVSQLYIRQPGKGVGKGDGAGLRNGFCIGHMHPFIHMKRIGIADMGDEGHDRRPAGG